MPLQRHDGLLQAGRVGAPQLPLVMAAYLTQAPVRTAEPELWVGMAAASPAGQDHY